jgi:hypothetical protein
MSGRWDQAAGSGSEGICPELLHEFLEPQCCLFLPDAPTC